MHDWARLFSRLQSTPNPSPSGEGCSTSFISFSLHRRTMEVESFLPLGERLSTVGVWRYPKQMTWPSAVATTTLPLATAGEAVTGEAASYSQTFLPLARSSP